MFYEKRLEAKNRKKAKSSHDRSIARVMLLERYQLCRPKSPADRMFYEKRLRAKNRENAKSSHNRSIVRVIFLKRDQNYENRSHVIASI